MNSFDPHRIFHWGFVVPNMTRGLTVWRGMGAVVLVEPAIDPIQNVECALLIYRDSVPIELVAPLQDGPNPVANRLKKGGGLDHVCLFSDDLSADLEVMRNDGGMVVVDPVYAAVFDRRLAFVATRAGLIVELMTRKVEGRMPADPLSGYFALTAR